MNHNDLPHWERDSGTGGMIKTSDRRAFAPGSVLLTLRVRPALRAFIGEQARLDGVRPFEFIRRALRSYLKTLMLSGRAFFQQPDYHLELHTFSDDMKKEIGLMEIEASLANRNGKSPKEIDELRCAINWMTDLRYRCLVRDQKKLMMRMRERWFYELGGARMVLENNGHDYRSLGYLLRALNQGVFPWHQDYVSPDDFIEREMAAGCDALGYPDDRYAADDARCGVHYEPNGDVWAERPGALCGDVANAAHYQTKEEYQEKYEQRDPPVGSLEEATHYDPSSAISQGWE